MFNPLAVVLCQPVDAFPTPFELRPLIFVFSQLAPSSFFKTKHPALTIKDRMPSQHPVWLKAFTSARPRTLNLEDKVTLFCLEAINLILLVDLQPCFDLDTKHDVDPLRAKRADTNDDVELSETRKANKERHLNVFS